MFDRLRIAVNLAYLGFFFSIGTNKTSWASEPGPRWLASVPVKS
jgi:hypothetical protein